MLLETNTPRVIELIETFDKLDNIDKLRLSIYLLENNYFNNKLVANDIVNLLK